jgi:hypothetical protein
LRPTAHQEELTGYAAALEDVWTGVAPAVAELERVAAEPARLETADLDGLRYALHRAAELAGGLRPPSGSPGVHDELAESLEGAREATAAVAAACEEGGIWAAEPLVWEWRGAIFGVRLARRRMTEQDPELLLPLGAEETAPGILRPLAATAAVILGALAVLVGALADQWPLWSAGIALVVVSLPLQGEGP